jgi:hypothetical protein
VAQHVTWRGNSRQHVFFVDGDYSVSPVRLSQVAGRNRAEITAIAW